MTLIKEQYPAKTSPNQRQVDLLKSHFPEMFAKNGEFLIEKFHTFLGKQIPLSQESYGLNWTGKSYAKALKDSPFKQLLKADDAHNQQEDNQHSQNILIKGDNLDVLKHLKFAYRRQVKMIYIDPPYNTGSDGFVYADKRQFTPAEFAQLTDCSLASAERVLAFTDKFSNSHSAWLSFMYPRLYLAKQLLTDDGVIFISIDDNEVAQLKLLCDEIFWEGNFVADFIRKTKSTTNDAKTGLNYQHEFLLCYAKNKEHVNLLGGSKDLSRYQNPDNDPNGAWVSTDPSAKSGTMINNYFEVINPYTGKKDLPPDGRFWLFSKNTLQQHIDEGRICFKKEHKENERGFIYKRFLKDLKTTQKTLDSLAFTQNAFLNQSATKELKALELVEYFPYPKGVEFIQTLINHTTNENDLILDFFAGSGTTAHAVMQLNAEDGGKRKFICVQLDEAIDPKKSQTAYDFAKKELGQAHPTIFDITQERIKRAGEKIKETYPNQAIDCGFQCYELTDNFLTKDTLAFETEQGQMPYTLELHADDYQTLLHSWRLYDGNMLTTPVENVDLAGYTAHLCGETLYLLYPNFTTHHLTALLEKLDSNKQFTPSRMVFYGESIESGKQQELQDALKNDHNRKSFNLPLIARY